MNSPKNHFRKIAIQGWRQFDNIEIDLHDRLTVITGSNGAGKSSLLRIFSGHFGFDRPFLSTPVMENDQLVYRVGIFAGKLARKISSFFRKEPSGSLIGTLSYTNGQESPIRVSESNAAQYSLEIQNQAHIEGVHIDSHQPISVYQTIGSIPSIISNSEHAYQQYNSEIQQRYHGGYSGFSPLYRMKEAIIAMAVFGEGNSRNVGNPALLSALNGFIEVLSKVLPPSLGFIDLSIRPPEVVIQTKSGEFLIDAASGGVSTLIDIAWRLHMYSIGRKSFVVTMDEPENHLHPSMQRSLMRRLLDAFPQAQFIVATHSPFIVSSVRDSSVYVLRYESSDERDIEGFIPETTTSRVISEKLDTLNKSSSANEVLRQVLGVEATIPEWVSEDLRSIVSKYSSQKITEYTLKSLRSELREVGYESQYPSALAQLVDQNDKTN